MRGSNDMIKTKPEMTNYRLKDNLELKKNNNLARTVNALYMHCIDFSLHTSVMLSGHE